MAFENPTIACISLMASKIYHVWSLITQSWGRLLEKDYCREDHLLCNSIQLRQLYFVRPSPSWIWHVAKMTTKNWRRQIANQRLLSPTLNANAYEAHNQVRFTTSGVFGYGQTPCCERKQQTVFLSYEVSLGGLGKRWVCPSTYALSYVNTLGNILFLISSPSLSRMDTVI